MSTKEFEEFTFFTPKECYTSNDLTEKDFFDWESDGHDLIQGTEEDYVGVCNEFLVGHYDNKQQFLEEWFDEGEPPDGDDYWKDNDSVFENDWLFGLDWMIGGRFYVLYKTRGNNPEEDWFPNKEEDD